MKLIKIDLTGDYLRSDIHVEIDIDIDIETDVDISVNIDVDTNFDIDRSVMPTLDLFSKIFRFNNDI